MVTAAVPGLFIALAALAGCSSSSSSAPTSSAAGAPALGFRAAAAPSAAGTSGVAGGSADAASAARLAPTGQQLIYTAQLTVRARSVSGALGRAISIVTGAGGYVSSETAATDQNHPAQSTATVVLKIPVAVYPATLSELTSALGTQLSLQQQAQDVTQEVADVSSQVTSDEAAITQLRALLKDAGSVADLLSVQDQINSEESSLEAMIAQENALNHETSYATVTVDILGPKAAATHKKAAPPPGLTRGLSAGWHAFRTFVSWFLAIVGAGAPFIALVAVLGGLAYWLRRRLAHRTRAGNPAD